jgi:phosphohistidine swiveling domain-containing protein
LESFFEKYQEKNRKYVLANEEGNISFLSLDYFFRAFCSDLPVKKGILSDVPDLLSFIENGYGRFYFEKEVMLKCADESLKKLLKDASFVRDIIYKDTIKEGEKALKIFDELEKINYSVSGEEAVKYIDKFIEINSTQISLNLLAVFDLYDHCYSDYIKKYLKSRLKSSDMSLYYVSEKLLASPCLTYTQILRIKLIKLVLGSRRCDRRLNKKLKKIWCDRRWLNYGYRGPEMSLEYFEKMFEELMGRSIEDLTKELDYLLNYEKSIKRDKEVIYKDLGVDDSHRSFIDAIALLSFLKIYRKDTAFLTIFMTYKMLEKFNDSVSRENLYYLTLDEAKKLVLGDLSISKKELTQRETLSAYLNQSKKMLLGKEAKLFVESNTESHNLNDNENNIKLLDGMMACLGETGNWVYGRVKVINDLEEISKMEDGDILVSVATTPDILPAMKKAGAIVTDHGGITCHAAIVSRELNIPCLIGTKYATKVFRDGDEVVVCPRHGYIKFQ